MVDKKLPELTELTSIADGDRMYIVDVSDTTDSAQGTSKFIQKSNLVTNLNLTDVSDVTASAADVNATTNFEETISATTSEVTIATGKTLNIADDGGLKLNETAITSTAAELNYLDGVTGADVGRRYFTKIVSTDASGDYQTDGTDDDVQIQAAIDAVGTAGGGVVLIRKGTYVVGTQIDVDSANIHVVGEGMGATILQAKTAFTTATDIVNITSSNCSIENLTIDGNKSNQTTENHDGVVATTGTQIVIKNVEVKNLNRNSGNTYGISLTANNSFIIGCISHDNELVGINCSGQGCSLVGCLAYSNAGIGIDIGGAGSSASSCQSNSNTGTGFDLGSGVVVSGCSARSNSGIGFLCATTTDTVITGCLAESNLLEGVRITGSLNTVVGNRIEDNGQHGIELNLADNCVVSNNLISVGATLDADNSHSGILLTGTATRNVVVGNRILKVTGTNDYAYGIREAASADDYNNISGNIVTDAQTAQVSTQGVNTVTDGSNITS